MTRRDTPDERRLAELLASEPPVEPGPDLVERIMAGIDTAESRSAPALESAVDRWNRVAWRVALVAAAAAMVVCVGAFTVDDSVAADPIAAITADDADLHQLLALSR